MLPVLPDPTAPASALPGQPRKLVLLLNCGHLGAEGRVLRGLFTYAYPDRPWDLFDAGDIGYSGKELARTLRANPPDVIVTNAYAAKKVAPTRLGCPVINITNQQAVPGLPRLGVNDHLAGRVAAEYFLERGHWNFGFAGHHGWKLSEERLAGFRERLAEAGRTVQVMPALPGPVPDLDATEHANRVRWLRSLPLPAAIFADMDQIGRLLCRAATAAGRRVPEDVAILGVGNNEIICELCSPPLSSIATPDLEIGYELGRWVEQALAGRPLPRERRFAPLGVVARRSTDAIVVADPRLAVALRLMHERIGEGISLKEILREVAISRVHLFRLFKKQLGRGPLEELQRIRCAAARRLLLETDLPVAEVARKCGLGGHARLVRVFTKDCGLSPSAFRSQQKG